ncbi:MAG: hypothetical protein ABIP94_03645 [Planctomycetota bacterium]
MQEWRPSRFGNPASWYTLLGVVMLGLSVWVPFLSAERTARIEQRADQIASHLLAAARSMPFELDGPTLEVVLARFFALAERDGVFTNDLQVLDPPLPATLLTLENKHYGFHLAISPPDPAAIVGTDTQPGYEVVAWPLSAVGPGRSVFFYPDNAPRAFTRNLSIGYEGLGDRRPVPGKCHRRTAQGQQPTSAYRAYDDERWILY